MANEEIDSHEEEAERLKEQLENLTRNELCELNRRVTTDRYQKPKEHDSEHVSDDEYGETSKMMHLDAIIEAADLESEYIEGKYGPTDAAAICSHMAVSSNMREYYRGDTDAFKEGMCKDVESLTEVYLEVVDTERQHYTDRIMLLANKSKTAKCKCDECDCYDCEYKRFGRAE